MKLPQPVQYCINQLEAAGFEAYAVGGCVRDSLLGLTPADYDLCTNAKPEETAHVFQTHQLLHHGQKHGTIGVVLDGQVYEITTFRTEGGYQDARHPDWVQFVPNVEEDLARRDFTINAMAYNPKTGYIDPFGGQQDMENRILRTVGNPKERFQEDALRILRGTRFSARFRLTPESATRDAMYQLAPLLEALARERVFEELCKLLLLVQPEDLIRFAPILTQVIPELAPLVGFDQHSSHHVYDVYTHTAHVTASVPATLPLRWAALLHDAGKPATFSIGEDGQGHFYGHAEASATIAEAVLRRLKAPTALREDVVLLIRKHMTLLEPDKRILRRRLSQLGSEKVNLLLALQEADTIGTGTRSPKELEVFSEIRRILAEIEAENACLSLKDLAISGHDLMALGYSGREIGKCLNHLLEQVIDEKLPNEKNALLRQCEKFQKD